MNKSQFTTVMFAMAGNFGAKIEPTTLDIWFRMAKDDGITYDELQSAAQRIMRSKKESYGRMPTYAEILEAAKGPAPKPPEIEDIAMVQANFIIDQLRRYGSLGIPHFDDPKTRALMRTRWPYCQWAASVKEKDLKWWIKDFIAAYKSETANERLAIAGDANKLIEGIGNEL